MEPGVNSIDLSVCAADQDVYRSAGYGGVQMYMKCESLPNQQDEIRHFYPINMKRSLRLVRLIFVKYLLYVITFFW